MSTYDSKRDRPNKEIHRKIFFNEIEKIDELYGTEDSKTTYHQFMKTANLEEWDSYERKNIDVRVIAIDSNEWSLAKLLYNKRLKSSNVNFVHVAFANFDIVCTEMVPSHVIFKWAKYGIFINHCDMYNLLAEKKVSSDLPLNLIWFDGMSAWDNRYHNKVESPSLFFNTLTSDRLRFKHLSQGCKIMVTLHISRKNADKVYDDMVWTDWIYKNPCIFTEEMTFQPYKENYVGAQWMALGQCVVKNNPDVPISVCQIRESDEIEIVSITRSTDKKRRFDDLSTSNDLIENDSGSESEGDDTEFDESSELSDDWSESDVSEESLYIDDDKFRSDVEEVMKNKKVHVTRLQAQKKKLRMIEWRRVNNMQ